jgi:hypothetical protein
MLDDVDDLRCEAVQQCVYKHDMQRDDDGDAAEAARGVLMLSPEFAWAT